MTHRPIELIKQEQSDYCAQLTYWETIASSCFIPFPCYSNTVSWKVTSVQLQIWHLHLWVVKGISLFLCCKLKHSQQGYHFIAVETLPFIFCDVILHKSVQSIAVHNNFIVIFCQMSQAFKFSTYTFIALKLEITWKSSCQVLLPIALRKIQRAEGPLRPSCLNWKRVSWSFQNNDCNLFVLVAHCSCFCEKWINEF